jgi:hypothetical protein
MARAVLFRTEAGFAKRDGDGKIDQSGKDAWRPRYRIDARRYATHFTSTKQEATKESGAADTGTKVSMSRQASPLVRQPARRRCRGSVDGLAVVRSFGSVKPAQSAGVPFHVGDAPLVA